MKKRTAMMILTILIITTIQPPFILGAPSDQEQSIIIEVEGNPHQHKQHIEKYYPFIEVVQVYDTLLQALALKGSLRHLDKVASSEFVQNTYPVRTYKTNVNKSVPFVTRSNDIPQNERYTGEGVKVGVIDTGIDHTHPDLRKNYKGGYDLVDLDKDPMETQPEQGMPTIHGTHVSGIIAANGAMKGVAPDAELYGYRALGPGGMGTSVSVIAAIEKAVKDEMDVINMSLGNTINGPDWPTSIAVNRAVELGVSVVIANGNAGPENWTVGSPATATKAIAVGASTPPLTVPFLHDSFNDKKIELTTLLGSDPWNLQKDYPLVDAGIGEEVPANATDKIVLMKRGTVPFANKARAAEKAGAKALIIYNNEEGAFQGSVDDGGAPISIPVAAVSKADGEWLLQQSKESNYWIDTKYQQKQDQMADFSSRGPVTANWHIKPEIVAPGAAINSTVPGGYQELQGTSMAAPHVAGGIALIKQAHPDWSPAQVKGALLTSALPLTNGETLYEPVDQGMGRMQPNKAIETPLIIYNPLLAFGKITTMKEKHTVSITLENVSDQIKTYSFELPNQQQGLRWYLPKSFTLNPGETKTVSVGLAITGSVLKEGIHQGWLTLGEGNNSYKLPFLFVNKDANYPKAMGLEFALKAFSEDEYEYRFYLPEKAEEVIVDLYNPHTLTFERTLLQLEDVQEGVIEGTIAKRNVGQTGEYLANIIIKTKEEKEYNHPTQLFIN